MLSHSNASPKEDEISTSIVNNKYSNLNRICMVYWNLSIYNQSYFIHLGVSYKSKEFYSVKLQ